MMLTSHDRLVLVPHLQVLWPAAFLAVHESFGEHHCDVSFGKASQGEIQIHEDELRSTWALLRLSVCSRLSLPFNRSLPSRTQTPKFNSAIQHSVFSFPLIIAILDHI
ncbi:hypothetical protein EDD22DRAFT_917206 [Suillus occidentalis]|nr:hypothetical protein EDD22DRAFT_917206 [Suillus occidentalis]